MGKMPAEESREKRMRGECARMERNLAQMLFEPDAAPVNVRTHFSECSRCSGELSELRATTALMDTWEISEPNPHFLTRLERRMQEERQAVPAGWRWIARLRDRYAYGPPAPVRPLAAMALTILLLLGGGAYLGVTNWDQPPAPTAQAAVVRDLQTMVSNAQLLDQLEALSTPSDSNRNGE